MPTRGRLRWATALLALTVAQSVGAQTPQPSVGQLLTDGWEIAGYAAALTTFGSIILFKHKDKNYLIQCSAVYDATRGPKTVERVVTNCYEIR